jgi:hypothetical protein
MRCALLEARRMDREFRIADLTREVACGNFDGTTGARREERCPAEKSQTNPTLFAPSPEMVPACGCSR